MKITISFLILFALLLTACGTPLITTVEPTKADTLNQLFESQDRATAAAQQYQNVSAKATTIAQVTREFMVLQGQQTRVALDNAATATAQALNVQATLTAGSANATRQSQTANATQTAQSAQATATREIERSNATASAQAAQYTATANAVLVQATQASASATSTALAANAQATRVGANATETVMVAQVLAATEKADWEKRTEAGRSIATLLGWTFVLIGAAVVIGFLAVLFGNAYALRVRTIRDGNDVPFIILPPDRAGRQLIAAPTRSPGAIINITPPNLAPMQVSAGAVDTATTQRDQAVSLMLAAGKGNASDAAQMIEDAKTPDQLPAPNLQISKPYEPKPLELEAQTSRLALPIGVTDSREMWIGLNEVTHALIGGPSGMGKTNFVHGWIQSLARGEQVDLALYDGKRGMEFGRYANAPRTHVVGQDALAPFLGDVISETQRRFELLRDAGVNNLADYNRDRDTDRLAHQVIFIDELYGALQMDGVESALLTIAREARAGGIHLVTATQLPDARSIPAHLRINSMLRIAFAVPSHQNSSAILGYAGAEKIEKTPGRLLVFWQGRMIQAQAFRAPLPPMPRPSGGDDPRQLPPPTPFDDETMQMIQYAQREGRGWFVVTAIAKALGIRDGRVSQIARNLEKQGWLTQVQKNDSGQNVGRQISQKLQSLVAA